MNIKAVAGKNKIGSHINDWNEVDEEQLKRRVKLKESIALLTDMKGPKFQFLYKGLPLTSVNSDFNWHKKVYFLSEFIDTNLSKLSDVHETSTLIATRQFTGWKSKSGIDIYEGDILGCRGAVYKLIKHEGGCYELHEAGSDKIFFLFKHACIIDVIGNEYQNPELLGEITWIAGEYAKSKVEESK
jgi:hypothetical protein